MVRWLPSSASSVDIEWEGPEMPNGVITGFIVTVRNYSGSSLVGSRSVDSDTFRVTFSTNLLGEFVYSVSAVYLISLVAM